MEGELVSNESNEVMITTVIPDELSNSFSDLEDNEERVREEQTEKIVIEEDYKTSFKQKTSNKKISEFQETIGTESPNSSNQELLKSQKERTPLIEEDFRTFKEAKQLGRNQQKEQRQYQIPDEEYIQKIKVIYSHSFLGSKKISLSQIKSLKVYLFIPKHGEQLVQWGNNKFGTHHSVTSALQRLQYIELSQCNHLTIKIKQNLKYILLLVVCVIVLKVLM